MKTLKDFWNYRVLGKTPPPPRGRIDPYNGMIVGSGAMKAVDNSAKSMVHEVTNPAERTALSWGIVGVIISRYSADWRDHFGSIISEYVENPLRRFMAMFQASQAVDPYQDRARGRVTPYDPNVWDKQALASALRAKRGVRAGMGVYRARAGQWEDFKDAQVKPIKKLPPPDDEVGPRGRIPNTGDFDG